MYDPFHTIGIIAPAGKLPQKIETAKIRARFETWGLHPKFGQFWDCRKEPYFAATDRQRAEDLQRMIDDPSVKAILAGRGGYGSVRLLPLVDFSSLRKNPKWIIGFSDITTLHLVMRRLGIESIHGPMLTGFHFDQQQESSSVESLRKALFGESVSNPGGQVLDIEKFARVAHSHGVPLIVDNTFPTPINCRPFEWGADIVTHSTTKYMDGHATSVGGAVVDSGRFDWQAQAERFPGLTRPDASYHGLVYTEAFGQAAYLTKLTAQLMRDLGSIPSPFNCFLLNLGLETLHLRVPRHCANALEVARWLKANEKVAWISYAPLEGDKYHGLAQKYMPGGTCGVIAFGLKGGREESIRFMDRLKFISIVTHVADARTCVLHPASHTHRQLSDEQLLEAGVRPDLIRLSVGIEDVGDILADLEQALHG